MYCQPLLNGLLDAINFIFDHKFCDNELRLATISNPMFNLSWLETEEVRRGKTLLKREFECFQGIIDESDTSEDSSDGTSLSRSGPSPEKKNWSTKNFFSSIKNETKKLN
ncbi:hypothetical protein OUZ56_011304 [Daphnia magna]|uniref:Uncharacterized protein n=1 Tax=Daphnia magna TaxID=35525 RepID=A0ABQ9YZT1_9CRUS|nr:hypothetical protein OUZ56_011304 [Daphnia magna]